MRLELNRRERLGLALTGAAALVLLYLGWKLFWFLTDDAYIAFRYVSNAHLGHGYVWNPPPFRPVEGYTSADFRLEINPTVGVSGGEDPFLIQSPVVRGRGTPLTATIPDQDISLPDAPGRQIFLPLLIR